MGKLRIRANTAFTESAAAETNGHTHNGGQVERSGAAHELAPRGQEASER
jgi:hypothetical protein